MLLSHIPSLWRTHLCQIKNDTLHHCTIHSRHLVLLTWYEISRGAVRSCELNLFKASPQNCQLNQDSLDAKFHRLYYIYKYHISTFTYWIYIYVCVCAPSPPTCRLTCSDGPPFKTRHQAWEPWQNGRSADSEKEVGMCLAIFSRAIFKSQ